MAGNMIKINNSVCLEWYVPDSTMGDVIEALHKFGSPTSETVEWEKSCLRKECENIEKERKLWT